MKSSIKSIKISTRSVSSELQKVKDRQNANEERMDDMEKAMQHVSDKVEEWLEEKAVLLEQINDLRARYDLKCDELEQYSRRLCLVLWGVEEKSSSIEHGGTRPFSYMMEQFVSMGVLDHFFTFWRHPQRGSQM